MKYKMTDKNKYSKDGKIYEEMFEGRSKKKNHEEETNIVKIAGRRIEIYNQTIIYKLQKFDQVELLVLDTYLDRALQIIKQWEPLGITPQKRFIGKGGQITFQKREEDIITREGKKFKKPVNRITLTKHPDLYRFTKI